MNVVLFFLLFLLIREKPKNHILGVNRFTGIKRKDNRLATKLNIKLDSD